MFTSALSGVQRITDDIYIEYYVLLGMLRQEVREANADAGRRDCWDENKRLGNREPGNGGYTGFRVLGEPLGKYQKIERIKTLDIYIYISAYQAIIRSYKKLKN